MQAIVEPSDRSVERVAVGRTSPVTLGATGQPAGPVVEEARPSGISEAALFAAYEPPLRVVPCACGGAIAARDTEASVIASVRAHQETPGHRRWREGEGY